MRLGIISGHTKEDFERARDMGLGFVELRTAAGGDADSLMGAVPDILGYIGETGVAAGVVAHRDADALDAAGRINERSLEETVKLIDVCALLECPVISLGCGRADGVSLLRNAENAVRYFSLVSGYAAEKGVRAAVHNDGGNNFIHSDPAWELVLGEAQELYIDYSPAQATYRGQDCLFQTAKWGGRFAHVRLGGVLRVAGESFNAPAGLDAINWGAFMACLYGSGYAGGLSVEPPRGIWSGSLGAWGVEYTVGYFKRMIFQG